MPTQFRNETVLGDDPVYSGLPTASGHDAWFRAKVQEALEDPRPNVPHEQVVQEVYNLINSKRRV